MATVVMTDGVFVFAGTDLTDHVTDVMLDIQGAELDGSTITDTWDTAVLGRKSATLTFTCLDDFASSNVDATLWGAFNTGTAVTFSLKSTSAATGSTNPAYTGSVLPSKSPVGGAAGELLKKALSLKVTGAVTRATS